MIDRKRMNIAAEPRAICERRSGGSEEWAQQQRSESDEIAVYTDATLNGL
jgi:hypothetical protein